MGWGCGAGEVMERITEGHKGEGSMFPECQKGAIGRGH